MKIQKLTFLPVVVLVNLTLVIGTSCSQSKRIAESYQKYNYEADFSALHQPEVRFAEMSPEEIRAFEIRVMRDIADLALVPPKLNVSPLPEYDYDQLDYGMTVSIERTPKGRLWAVWVAGEDGPKAFMVANTSDDNGENWSKPRLVIDSQSENLPRHRSIIVGNLWTDPRGRLWFFFDQTMEHFDGRGGLWASVCENPDEEDPQWSAPRRIWHGSMLNKPLVLSTGEWLLPVQLLEHNKGYGPFDGIFPELDPYRGANVFISKDEGASFSRLSKVRFPEPNWYEHMLVERKDGTLWMLARTRNGIMESVSHDHGLTWSAPVNSAIKHPVARFHIRRVNSGRLLLIKHGETIDSYGPGRGRSMLTAWLSNDDGKTWEGGLMLDERDHISYPDATQAPDGTIFVSYDRERSQLGEVLMARITEEDILSGRIVSEGSKLKLLISKPMNKGMPDRE